MTTLSISGIILGMVFKTKIGITFYILLSLQIVMTIVLITFVIFLGSVWYTWLFAILAVIFAGVFFLYFIIAISDTLYSIADDHLFIKTGWYELEIPFNSIVEVSSGVKNKRMKPSLSFARLKIMYKTPHGYVESVRISPVNENEFIALLESKIQDS